MATKKQKRTIAEAKRAEFDAKVKADGLAALREDQERQRLRRERLKDADSEGGFSEESKTLIRLAETPVVQRTEAQRIADKIMLGDISYWATDDGR